MRGFKYLSNVSTLKIISEKCVGCGKCLEVCPHGVLAISSDKVKHIDLNSCIECGACAKNCPVDAFFVDVGVGCAAGLIKEWLRGRRIFSSTEGCC